MDEMFITCILDIVDPNRELSSQAVIKLVKEKFTSTNNARDEIPPSCIKCTIRSGVDNCAVQRGSYECRTYWADNSSVA